MAGTISLQTPRLLLRRHMPEDARVLYENFGTDAAMFRYSGWNPYATQDQARETVQRFIDSYAKPRFYGWAIECEGRMIGTIGAYDYDQDKNKIEVGFSIERASWGKGYAAEALLAVLEYLTVQEGIARVTAWCASDNIASKRTLEKGRMRLTEIDAGGLEVSGERYDRLDYVYDGIKSETREYKMKLTMLGTGNALVTECYNTCFLLEDNKQLFMVDGGGGNAVLHQIRHAGYDWIDIHHIFVTHKHIDHLLGIIWMVRMICQFMDHGEYKGDAYIYSHGEVLALIRDMAGRLLREKEAAFIGDRLHLIEVTDGETRKIIGHEVTFFDIQSTKVKQFGFRMDIGNGEALTCCGDEPLAPAVERYTRGSQWMLNEAFCLYSQADVFDPYEKHHSTVKEACELAERLGIKNLLLYHTEDQNLSNRKELYSQEGMQYYHGSLWIPDDLERMDI